MKTLALPGTGASLGDYEQMTAHGREMFDTHTRIGKVGDPALERALTQFDLALTAPLAALNAFTQHTAAVVVSSLTAVFDIVSGIPWAASSMPAGHEITGQDDPVVTIEGISQRLGVPVRDALKAAGISRSTFYSWKGSNELRPRLSSQGRLWELAQTVDDLDETIPGVGLRPWFLADRRRMNMLRKGSFDALLRDAANDPAHSRHEPAPVDFAGSYAVGGDRQTENPGVPASGNLNRRKVASAPVRRRTDRRSR